MQSSSHISTSKAHVSSCVIQRYSGLLWPLRILTPIVSHQSWTVSGTHEASVFALCQSTLHALFNTPTPTPVRLPQQPRAAPLSPTLHGLCRCVRCLTGNCFGKFITHGAHSMSDSQSAWHWTALLTGNACCC